MITDIRANRGRAGFGSGRTCRALLQSNLGVAQVAPQLTERLEQPVTVKSSQRHPDRTLGSAMRALLVSRLARDSMTAPNDPKCSISSSWLSLSLRLDSKLMTNSRPREISTMLTHGNQK